MLTSSDNLLMVDPKKYPWIQEFKLSPESLSGWDGQFLSTLFNNEVISEEKYLSWAQNYYGLAILDRDFFYYPFEAKKIENQIQMSKELWNQECYPIYQWENIIYIACLKPIDIVIDGYKVCFVLSSPQALKFLWNNHIEAMVQKTGIYNDIPAGLIDTDNILNELDFGFGKKTQTPKDETSTKSAILKQEIETTDVIVDKSPVAEKTTEPLPIPPAIDETSLAMEPTYLGTENIRTLDDILLNEAKDHVQDCESIEDGVMCIMKKTRGFFKKMMWLSPSAHSYQAKLSWGNWEFDEEKAGSEVNIHDANPFKIVHKTKLPYHGPVYMNDVNQMYVDWWNHAKPLEHLTIQPVIINGECFGCILGADKGREFDNDTILKQMDRLSKRLADNISKLLTKQNPAA